MMLDILRLFMFYQSIYKKFQIHFHHVLYSQLIYISDFLKKKY